MVGNDIAVFSGAVANYQITANGDGSVTVAHLSGGADGTDTLRGIERLQFADGIIDTPQAASLRAIVEDASDADASADNAVVFSANDGEALLWCIGGSQVDGGDVPSNLWPSARDTNLVISHLGTADSVFATGWHTSFGGTAAQSETVQAADVNSLISQMAAFSAQVGCDASALEPSALPPEYALAVSLPWQANG